MLRITVKSLFKQSTSKFQLYFPHHISLVIANFPVLFFYPSLGNSTLSSIPVHRIDNRLVRHTILFVNQIKQIHTSLTIPYSLL